MNLTTYSLKKTEYNKDFFCFNSFQRRDANPNITCVTLFSLVLLSAGEKKIDRK